MLSVIDAFLDWVLWDADGRAAELLTAAKIFKNYRAFSVITLIFKISIVLYMSA